MTAPTCFGHIEPFRKGGNWKAFVQQLEAFITLNDIAEEKKAALLLTQVSQEIFAQVPAICETDTPLSLKYEILKEKLENHYQPKPNQQLQRFTFRARKQGSNESIQDYMIALRTLVQKCQFKSTEVNSQLKDQLITGVHNKQVRYELLKAPAEESLDTLMKLAKTVEVADAKASGLDTPMSENVATQEAEIHAIQAGWRSTATNRGRRNVGGSTAQREWMSARNSRGIQRPSNQRDMSRSQAGGRTCYCCGGNNHIRADCWLKNKYCSECGSQGHIFKMCRGGGAVGRGSQTRNQNHIGDEVTEDTKEQEQEEKFDDEDRFACDFSPVRECGKVDYELKKKLVHRLK
ncbi:uncharacterized protein LOC143218559 [Lasioglossum baleicum]|uniref:uncharacterized protein LOC143218559 n=1 Tax=Lasioglossum baleicum TaxID=434251 RepID=UPI003FCDDDE0